MKATVITTVLVIVGAIYCGSTLLLPSSYAQNSTNATGGINQSGQPVGTAMASKYLSVKDFKFRQTTDQFSNPSITGTLVNNSTQEVSGVQINVIIFDQHNRVLTAANGAADVSDLKPGDNSAFKVDLTGLGTSDVVHHYLIFPTQTK
ncbi:MAG: FxLYD domain-containing protein [Thermoproteota archaeon]|nr:FxLYD domain-containing protein [Thermoproteota archaeon]